MSDFFEAIEEAFQKAYRSGLEIRYKELEKQMCHSPSDYPSQFPMSRSTSDDQQAIDVESKEIKEEVDPWRPKYKPIIDFEAEEKEKENPVSELEVVKPGVPHFNITIGQPQQLPGIDPSKIQSVNIFGVGHLVRAFGAGGNGIDNSNSLANQNLISNFASNYDLSFLTPEQRATFIENYKNSRRL